MFYYLLVSSTYHSPYFLILGAKGGDFLALVSETAARFVFLGKGRNFLIQFSWKNSSLLRETCLTLLILVCISSSSSSFLFLFVLFYLFILNFVKRVLLS